MAREDDGVATVMNGYNCVGCMSVVKFNTDAQKREILGPMASGVIHIRVGLYV